MAELDIGEVMLLGCRCRCGHEWLPRDRVEKPRVCPKCKSPTWDKPYTERKKIITVASQAVREK